MARHKRRASPVKTPKAKRYFKRLVDLADKGDSGRRSSRRRRISQLESINVKWRKTREARGQTVRPLLMSITCAKLNAAKPEISEIDPGGIQGIKKALVLLHRKVYETDPLMCFYNWHLG